jgi:hypothetical protein
MPRRIHTTGDGVRDAAAFAGSLLLRDPDIL